MTADTHRPDTHRPDPLVVPGYVLIALAALALAHTLGTLTTVLWVAAGFVVLGAIVLTPLGVPVSRVIDAFNGAVGRWVAWLLLAAIAVSTVNAVVRKVFDISSNSWLELQWVLFGAVFLLCAPWTLLSNEHIRIDIVNSMLSRRLRNWVDVIGHLVFLIPFCIVMVTTSWGFSRATAPSLAQFAGAFAGSPLNWPLNVLNLGEQSMNAGGLPQWPAKFLVLIGFVLLLAQGVSELAKRIAVMQGRLDDTAGSGSAQEAAEAEARRLLEAAATDPAIAR